MGNYPTGLFPIALYASQEMKDQGQKEDQGQKLWRTDKILTFVEKQIFALNDSFDVLMKLILPESIEEYFELTSYKKVGEAKY